MKTVDSKLTVVNETAVRGAAIVSLIQSYIQGIIEVVYGFVPLTGGVGRGFPCLFVDPKSQNARMITTGKYQINIVYDLYFYVIENKPGDALDSLTSISETLIKLFSNNALGDLNTTFSKQFKTYANPSGGMYWLDSEMRALTMSDLFINAIPNRNEKYMRNGMMEFEIMDVIQK
jgi:hypothetical protein